LDRFFESRVLVVLALLLFGLTCTRAQDGPSPERKAHNRTYWHEIAKNRYAVPAGQPVFPLAQELSGYLASPDPELRDDLSYSILATWIARKQLSGAELTILSDEWKRNLGIGIGEAGLDTVFVRSFSALCLASLAEHDLKNPFLTPESYRALLDSALTYLRDEKDLRGFDARKGWIHATAHTADLIAALGSNRLFEKQDQPRVLEAIAQRLATASEVFTMGEQDRLANAAVTLMMRKDFDSYAWQTWLSTLSQDQAVWNDSPPKMNALVRFQNDSYFLRAIVAQASLRPPSAALAEAIKPVLVMLGRR